MKHRVFNTTRKQNDRACSGKHRIHLGRKKHACLGRRSRPYFCVSSITRDSSLWIHCTRTKVNQHSYLEVMTRLRESVRRKGPRLWPDKWILHRDNAPAHDALRVREFLAKNTFTKMDHPSYSPDLAPCDFLALSKIKKCPEGTKICRPFWHPTQREKVTVRYCGKWFSRLFPAVAPLSHKVHSFTRQVFRRRQQLLVHK